MSAATRKGQRFERLIANHLRDRLNDDRIDIRPKNGTNDRGDIGGLRTIRGGRIVAELKNHAKFELGKWLLEADIERGHDDADVGLVIFKRPRTQVPDEQYVLMDVETLCRLIEGGATNAPATIVDPHTVVTE